MAFQKMTADVNNVQKLDDHPNDTAGMSPTQLKAVFDTAGNQCKDFINALITALETNGAANIGIDTIEGLSGAATVQTALARLLQMLNDTALGAVPDASLTNVKFANKTIEGGKIADVTITDANIYSVAGNKVIGAVPIASGGTGANSAEDAIRALLAGGPMILSSNQYGDMLPSSGLQEGQIFFKRVT